MSAADGPKRGRRVLRATLALLALGLAASCIACSPIYVAKAGLAEWRILRARQPIHEVLADTTVEVATRTKLTYVLHARRFATERFGIDPGDSYTLFTQLERDTLALVLTAARKDRLVPKTWWFPIVGRVPYKGYFSEEDALASQRKLDEEGLDTYLRPTAAFSTLGWFNDPVLSTMLQADEVEVVETVLHELSHQYLFVPGRVQFNESFANFAGRVGAIEFFCNREGGGPDTVKCQRAEARWRDYIRFSLFLDQVVEELEAIYESPALATEEKLAQREEVFRRALTRFDEELTPTLESATFGSFRTTPLNNATLLGRMQYYHRLTDFQALLDAEGGDLSAVLSLLREGADRVEDPFELLPRTREVPTPRDAG